VRNQYFSEGGHGRQRATEADRKTGHFVADDVALTGMEGGSRA
jgi:hypothetical protein